MLGSFLVGCSVRLKGAQRPYDMPRIASKTQYHWWLACSTSSMLSMRHWGPPRPRTAWYAAPWVATCAIVGLHVPCPACGSGAIGAAALTVQGMHAYHARRFEGRHLYCAHAGAGCICSPALLALGGGGCDPARYGAASGASARQVPACMMGQEGVMPVLVACVPSAAFPHLVTPHLVCLSTCTAYAYQHMNQPIKSALAKPQNLSLHAPATAPQCNLKHAAILLGRQSLSIANTSPTRITLMGACGCACRAFEPC